MEQSKSLHLIPLLQLQESCHSVASWLIARVSTLFKSCLNPAGLWLGQL